MSATQVNSKEPKLESLNWGRLQWIHIQRPTKAETDYLAQHFPFHPLNLEDILSVVQRAKIDEYDDHLFVVLHFPCFMCEHVTTFNELDIFIGKDFIVSIDCPGNLTTLADFFKLCQENEEARRGNLRHGTGYLLYRIIDKLVDDCFPVIDRLADNVEKIEDRIFSERVHTVVKDLSLIRRDIITFRRIIWPMRAVISSLEPKISRFSDIDLTDYFGDTIDHVDKIWDALDEYKEIVEGLSDTQYILSSNRINDVLRVLTILTTIASILIIVPSFYGMNVPLPGGSNPGGHPASWLVVLISMVLSMAVLLLYFRRKGWL
jgi:magnesium transporter